MGNLDHGEHSHEWDFRPVQPQDRIRASTTQDLKMVIQVRARIEARRHTGAAGGVYPQPSTLP